MALERTVEHEGEVHHYLSEIEGDTFIDSSEWVLTQSQEMIDGWNEFQSTGKTSEISERVYNGWLVACKITHTVKKGDEIKLYNNYKEIEHLIIT